MIQGLRGSLIEWVQRVGLPHFDRFAAWQQFGAGIAGDLAALAGRGGAA